MDLVIVYINLLNVVIVWLYSGVLGWKGNILKRFEYCDEERMVRGLNILFLLG